MKSSRSHISHNSATTYWGFQKVFENLTLVDIFRICSNTKNQRFSSGFSEVFVFRFLVDIFRIFSMLTRQSPTKIALECRVKVTCNVVQISPHLQISAIQMNLAGWQLWNSKRHPTSICISQIQVLCSLFWCYFGAHFVPITVRFFTFSNSECACALFLDVYSVTVRTGLKAELPTYKRVRVRMYGANIPINGIWSLRRCSRHMAEGSSAINMLKFWSLISSRVKNYREANLRKCDFFALLHTKCTNMQIVTSSNLSN